MEKLFWVIILTALSLFATRTPAAPPEQLAAVTIHPAAGNPHPAAGNPHPAASPDVHPALNPQIHFAFPGTNSAAATTVEANESGTNVMVSFPNASSVTIILPPTAQINFSGGNIVLNTREDVSVITAGGRHAREVKGLEPGIIHGFNPNPVTGFNPNPVSGFNPNPVTGFNPNPVTGFNGGAPPFQPNLFTGSNFPAFVPSVPSPMQNTNFGQNPAAGVIVTGGINTLPEPPAAAVATNPTINPFFQPPASPERHRTRDHDDGQTPPF